jgi:hypothetical protein
MIAVVAVINVHEFCMNSAWISISLKNVFLLNLSFLLTFQTISLNWQFWIIFHTVSIAFHCSCWNKIISNSSIEIQCVPNRCEYYSLDIKRD